MSFPAQAVLRQLLELQWLAFIHKTISFLARCDDKPLDLLLPDLRAETEAGK